MRKGNRAVVKKIVVYVNDTLMWVRIYLGLSGQLGFHCIPCISSYLGDDAMMLPQHLTCVSEFEEVLRLSESQGTWG